MLPTSPFIQVGEINECTKQWKFVNVTFKDHYKYSNRFTELYNVIMEMHVNKDNAGFKTLLTLLTKCIVLEHVLFCTQSYVDYYHEINAKNEAYSLIKKFLMRLNTITLQEALIDCTRIHERMQAMGDDMQVIDFECHIRKSLDSIRHVVFPALNSLYATIQGNIVKQVDKMHDLLALYKLHNLITQCQKCKRAYTYYEHKSCNHRLCTKCAFRSLIKVQQCLVCAKINILRNNELDSDFENSVSNKSVFNRNTYVSDDDDEDDENRGNNNNNNNNNNADDDDEDDDDNNAVVADNDDNNSDNDDNSDNDSSDEEEQTEHTTTAATADSDSEDVDSDAQQETRNDSNDFEEIKKVSKNIQKYIKDSKRKIDDVAKLIELNIKNNNIIKAAAVAGTSSRPSTSLIDDNASDVPQNADADDNSKTTAINNNNDSQLAAALEESELLNSNPHPENLIDNNSQLAAALEESELLNSNPHPENLIVDFELLENIAAASPIVNSTVDSNTITMMNNSAEPSTLVDTDQPLSSISAQEVADAINNILELDPSKINDDEPQVSATIVNEPSAVSDAPVPVFDDALVFDDAPVSNDATDSAVTDAPVSDDDATDSAVTDAPANELSPSLLATKDTKPIIKTEPTGIEDAPVEYYKCEYEYQNAAKEKMVVIKVEVDDPEDDDCMIMSPKPRKRSSENDDDDDDVIIVEEENAVFQPIKPKLLIVEHCSRVVYDANKPPTNKRIKLEK
ncbi:HOAR [Agrotis ipsilon multiple nucleopolyhedrovirus]|uniref:HOAR n=1 Tax=Agrotis ipsilon multiple nucleopolyhedrovirus TaxID=208013 RepID=B6D5R8_9ABAC|nr:HOAR [Agrotis ipsilon multiple nucleopolyhedrovirus]ACI28706.1 HOAR [Agrotis ipsilon multiple nucleopolyhedrovirus]